MESHCKWSFSVEVGGRGFGICASLRDWRLPYHSYRVAADRGGTGPQLHTTLCSGLIIPTGSLPVCSYSLQALKPTHTYASPGFQSGAASVCPTSDVLPLHGMVQGGNPATVSRRPARRTDIMPSQSPTITDPTQRYTWRPAHLQTLTPTQITTPIPTQTPSLTQTPAPTWTPDGRH